MPPLVLYWIVGAVTLWIVFKVGVLFGSVLPRHRALLWIGGPRIFAAALGLWSGPVGS